MIKSILLIEDDADLANELSAFLMQNDFLVDIAQSGQAAKELLNKSGYTLCLLDVGLPDCSGFDLCKSIRTWSSIPIIMLTAYDEEDDIVKGLECGADDYVTKPYSVRVLFSRISTQMRRFAPVDLSSFRILKSGDLVIDTEHKMIFLNGAELAISATEYELCATLARSDNQIMSRSLLLEKVWDSRGKYVDNNTLSVLISRLRKKLGVFGNTPYIDTVKGIGYRWNIGVYGSK